MSLDKLEQLRIELTKKCNLGCLDCYTRQFRKEDKEFSVGEIINLIDDALPIGLKILSITGGEPLLEYEKLRKVLQYAKSKNLETGLLTNGILASEQIVKQLEAIGLNWVRISLDGSNNKVNSLTRMNSFEPTVEAIKRFNKSKVFTIVRTTVHSGNYDDLGNLINLALEVGIPKLELQPYILLTREDMNSRFAIPVEVHENVVADLIRAKRRHAGKLDISLLSGWFEFLSTEYAKDVAQNPSASFLHFDPSHVNSLHIDYKGDVRSCGCNSLSLGNVRSNTLSDIFYNSQYLKDLRAYNASNYCPKCDCSNLCFPCPAPRTNIHGTVNSASPNCPKVRRGENK